MLCDSSDSDGVMEVEDSPEEDDLFRCGIPFLNLYENPADIPVYLADLETNGLLSVTRTRKLWRYFAPALLGPPKNPDCFNKAYDAKNIGTRVFEPLETFMFNGRNEEEMLKILEGFNETQHLCGRVFKPGEPTYTCRDCWMDRTCVLCMECFRNSEHLHHRYKMCSSEGGGFCDCGDPEAWKSCHSCSKHASADDKLHDGSEIVAQLPDKVAARVDFVFRSCLDYCLEVLGKSHTSKDFELTKKDREITEPFDFSELTRKFATIIYNDEIHSYNLVTYTLVRSIDVTVKVATAYTTLVDQEGRGIIYINKLTECEAVRTKIKQISTNDPLRTGVVPCATLAHELFCLKMLSWLLKIVNMSNGFKKICADILCGTHSDGEPGQIISRIMQHDTRLWKSARAAWHNLFISVMLMNWERKREFAVIFTKNYTHILDDYVDDDQVPSASVVSLSVQLFTVPSVAHYLIEEHSILSKLLFAYTAGVDIGSQPNFSPGKIKRARVIFGDLSYLLVYPPTDWTAKLRCGFLSGFGKLVGFLCTVSGSHGVVRQMLNHVEYEADSENSMRLQLKMTPVLSSMLKWCATDRVVFMKAFRATVDKRLMGRVADNKAEKKVGAYSTLVNAYDITVQSASLHYPIPRMLAGLLQLLPKFNLNWNSPELAGDRLPLADYIEYPLRVKLLQAQVNAGMWRRNGLSLMKQLMYYSSVKFREEMHDRDVYMMQFAGANMDPNVFLVTLLAKYKLDEWADSSTFNIVPSPDDDRVHQYNGIIEEFLVFLITVVAERYNVTIGRVGPDECARKEILQLLCMGDVNHSYLMRSLPEDLGNDPQLEERVMELAVFKPSVTATKKGSYVLKEECWEEFNLFFHHYTREDHSKAEANFRRVAKMRGTDDFCHPPPLIPLSENFVGLANVMQCDVMLLIMKGLFERTWDLKCYMFTEGQLQRGLFLLGFALRQEELAVKFADDSYQFCARAKESGLYDAFAKLNNNERLGSHRALYNWVFSKFKEVELLRSKSDERQGESDQSTIEMEKESAKAMKRMRKERADQMKSKILAQMKAKQKRFINENQNFYEACGPSVGDVEMVPAGELFLANAHQVALGKNQTQPITHTKSYKCMLCQETELLDPTNQAMVLCAYVQQSTVLSKANRARDATIADPHYAMPAYEPAVLTARLEVGPHVSSCGHVLHVFCWRRHVEDSVKRERRRARGSTYDPTKHEFQCPLCMRLSNTILPLVAPLVKYSALVDEPAVSGQDVKLQDWVTAMNCVARLAFRNMAKSFSPESVQAAELDIHNAKSSPTSAPIRLIRDAGDPYAAFNINMDDIMQEVDSDNSVSDDDSSDPVELFCTSTPKKHRSAADTPNSDQDEDPSMSEEEVTALATLKPLFHPVSRKLLRKEMEPAVVTMVNLFAANNYCTGFRREQCEEYAGIPVGVWAAVGFTIRSVEWELRDEWKPVLGNFTVRQLDTVSPLVKTGALVGCEEQNPVKIVKMMRYVMDPLFLPYEDTRIERTSIMHMDAFSALVTLTYGQRAILDFPYVLNKNLSVLTPEWLPWRRIWESDPEETMGAASSAEVSVMIPKGDGLDVCAMQFCAVLHLTQLVLLHGNSSPPDVFNDEADDYYLTRQAVVRRTAARNAKRAADESGASGDAKMAARSVEGVKQFVALLAEVCSEAGIEFVSPDVTADYVEALETAFRAYLRCCTIFAHFLTDVPPSAELSEVDGDTYKELASYVGLPETLDELLLDAVSIKTYSPWIRRWIKYPKVKQFMEEQKQMAGSEKPLEPFAPPRINRLIKLPDEFLELINQTSSFKCSHEPDTWQNHTVCLVCGKILCSPGYCCQVEIDSKHLVGAATYHTRCCGAGTGIFFVVQSVIILLLSEKGKGCNINAPYVDKFGEPDSGLRRGDPLTLHKERYLELQRKWLSHSIPESTSSAMDNSSQYMSTDWNQL